MKSRVTEISDYADAKRYLYSLKYHGAKYGIDRMILLAEALEHPEREFPAIHIAGTNGKGSTAAMLEVIYRTAGLKTGLFTSPHLVYQGGPGSNDLISNLVLKAGYTGRLGERL